MYSLFVCLLMIESENIRAQSSESLGLHLTQVENGKNRVIELNKLIVVKLANGDKAKGRLSEVGKDSISVFNNRGKSKDVIAFKNISIIRVKKNRRTRLIGTIGGLGGAFYTAALAAIWDDRVTPIAVAGFVTFLATTNRKKYILNENVQPIIRPIYKVKQNDND